MSPYLDENHERAAQLVDATRNGKLADAYRVLQSLPAKDVQAVAQHAGFSCISDKNRRDFMAHLVAQVAEATRNRTDGFGLRALQNRARQAEA